jgi:hypothetical protein
MSSEAKHRDVFRLNEALRLSGDLLDKTFLDLKLVRCSLRKARELG